MYQIFTDNLYRRSDDNVEVAIRKAKTLALTHRVVYIKLDGKIVWQKGEKNGNNKQKTNKTR